MGGILRGNSRCDKEYDDGGLISPSYRVPVKVPAACVSTPEDVIGTGRGGMRAKFHDLREFTPSERGGHFAAYEVPEIIGKSAIKFFNNVELDKYKT